MNINIRDELQRLLQIQQEESVYHQPMSDEMTFYQQVAGGDLSILNGPLETEPAEGLGRLSDVPLQSRKYHQVILISMITRLCIENGLEPELAYTMSDIYIQQIDRCQTDKEISILKRQIITDFTMVMHDLLQKPKLSLHVQHGVDYITKHLTTNVKSIQVADYLHLNIDYLSQLFHKETGFSLQQYILHRKCESACYMLTHSQATTTEIAAFFAFSSTSHFITQFKKFYHCTPSTYRRREFTFGTIGPSHSSVAKPQ